VLRLGPAGEGGAGRGGAAAQDPTAVGAYHPRRPGDARARGTGRGRGAAASRPGEPGLRRRDPDRRPGAARRRRLRGSRPGDWRAAARLLHRHGPPRRGRAGARPMIDAFHLPGLAGAEVASWDVRQYGDGAVHLRFPVLEPATLGAVLDGLVQARAEHLADRPFAEIVAVIDAVARRFLDPADPVRRLAEEELPAVTGYSPPMVRLILDRMAADWRADALERLLREELGDPGVLDGFRPRTGPGDGESGRAGAGDGGQLPTVGA